MGRVDAIERTITVTSPIAKVWEALTAAEHLAQWFGDSAEVDLRPGGALRFGWSDYGESVAGVVEEVDPPARFSYRWDAGRDDAGRMWSTKVTFTLSEVEGTTTVTVAETGLAALPDELHGKTLEENTSGWRSELADLQQYLARVATR